MHLIASITFKIDPEFINLYKDKQPSWGPLGYVTYKRTYARPSEDGTTEEFYQTLERVVNGTFSIQKNHCLRSMLPWSEDKAQRTAKKMFQAMWDFKFLPPGRGLWSMGTEHVVQKGGLSLNNCAYLQIKTPSDIGTLMDMLMLGVGVGFSVNDAKIKYRDPNQSVDFHTIPDTREGWVNSVVQLISNMAEGVLTQFDYSLIRLKGTLIKGFGGTASGPEPLMQLHDSIKKIMLDGLDEAGYGYMNSLQVLDICNLVGKCVVAGNVRRSAEIALGLPTDNAFVNAKLDLESLLSHRWASNNSLICTPGMSYDQFGESTATNGEPGYFWLDNAKAYSRMNGVKDNKDNLVVGVNPCSEQTLEHAEVCCLVETFPGRHDNLTDYLDTLKLAYLYAKTVTLVPTHLGQTNSVMLRNRRIGCSQSGIIGAFNKHGRRTMFNWCDTAYSYIRGLDQQYSSWLCVPTSIKVTSVKPSGTVSLLPGETPGIHYPHSEYYIRRIRFASNSPMLKSLIDSGYPVEPDFTNPDNTMVVSFPVKENNFGRSKDEVSMWEQLENAAQYQTYWADNAVSVTITFSKDEAKDIPKALELYESRLKAVSFLPLSDHGYEQAPYETISEEQYQLMTSNITRFVSNESGNNVGSSYCDSDKCIL